VGTNNYFKLLLRLSQWNPHQRQLGGKQRPSHPWNRRRPRLRRQGFPIERPHLHLHRFLVQQIRLDVWFNSYFWEGDYDERVSGGAPYLPARAFQHHLIPSRLWSSSSLWKSSGPGYAHFADGLVQQVNQIFSLTEPFLEFIEVDSWSIRGQLRVLGPQIWWEIIAIISLHRMEG
jgi:hypothetical protein